MKILVALGKKNHDERILYDVFETNIQGEKIKFGLLDVPPRKFDNTSQINKNNVLIKVKYFSCNFRDRAILIDNYESMRSKFISFGSEFSGEVVSVGSSVPNDICGKNVMGRCDYPYFDDTEDIGGVTTNHASSGWIILHYKRIKIIPNKLEMSMASNWGLSAQTAASMIRKSGVLTHPNANVLILSARSDVSIAIAQQLYAHGIKPTLLSTNEWTEFIDGNNQLKIHARKKSDFSEQNKYSFVFDPFFDMNMDIAIFALNFNGIYVTCGLVDQHPLISNRTPIESGLMIRSAFITAIIKNITIIGNCLGTSTDYDNVVSMLESGKITPVKPTIFNVEDNLKPFVQDLLIKKNNLTRPVLCYKNEYTD